MFKVKRLFLGKGKKKGKDYLWTKCPKVKERKGTSTCGQNVHKRRRKELVEMIKLFMKMFLL